MKFDCLGNDCKNHCCKSYSGMESKMRQLSGISFEKIILLPDDIAKIKDIGRTDLLADPPSNGIVTIKTAKDGTCAALVNGRCSIYNNRPAICHAYPLYLDMFTGVCVLNECEAAASVDYLSELKANLFSLMEIYRFWIDYYEKEINAWDEAVNPKRND